MPKPNLDSAISVYKDLKQDIGKIPTSRQFYSVFPKKALEGLFEGGNSYSRLQELAGDTPNSFSSDKSDLNEILLRWGELARSTISNYGKLPISSDWKLNKLRPSVSGIEQSHKIKWSEIPSIFLNRFSKSAEWGDVIRFIQGKSRELPVPTPKGEECFVYLMKDLRNNAHKIGISSNPGVRERTLQSEQPKMKLIAAKKYINRKIALSIEKALHETYSHKRKRGEWFNLDEEDIYELSQTLDDLGR